MPATEKLTILLEAKNQAQKELDKVNRELKKMGTESSTANKKLVDATNKGTASLGSMFKSLTGVSLGIGGLIAGFGFLGKGMISAAAQFEQSEIAFTTMLGSAEKANTMLRELADFAARTPFELVGIEKTAKQLLAYGLSTEKIIPTLKRLGDVSAGLSVPIEQVAYAYGQVRAANQLYGTELRQFVNAGVPILDELAKMFGVTAGEAKKMVEEGKVGFKDVEEAFKNMSEEGGRFENLMAKQSKTLLGRISNLKDSWNIFLRTQGQQLIAWAGVMVDFLARIVDWLKKDAEGFNWVGKTIYGLALFFGALGKTVWAVMNVFVQFAKSVYALGKVSFAVVKDMWNNFKNLGDRLKTVFSALAQFFKGDFKGAFDTIKNLVNTSFSSTIDAYQGYIDQVKGGSDSIVDSWGGAMFAWMNFAELSGYQQVIKKYGELGDGTKDIGAGLDTMGEKGKEAAEKASKAAEALLKQYEKISDEIVSIQDKLTELEVENSKQQLGFKQNYAESYVKQEERIAKIREELAKKANDLVEAHGEMVRSTDAGSAMRKYETLRQEKAELERNLAEQEKLLEKHATIAMVYSDQITELKRFNNLSEFEQELELLNKKQIQYNIEYSQKREQLMRELTDKQAQAEAILGIEEQVTDGSIQQAEKRTNAIVGYLNTEMSKLKELVRQYEELRNIKVSTGVPTFSQSTYTPALATNNQVITSVGPSRAADNITLTVTGNTFLDENGAEKVGDLIIQKLGSNSRI